MENEPIEPPRGERKDIVTYSVRDPAGAILDQGVVDILKALDRAEAWAANHTKGFATVHRVTFTTFREEVQTNAFEANGSALTPEATPVVRGE